MASFTRNIRLQRVLSKVVRQETCSPFGFQIPTLKKAYIRGYANSNPLLLQRRAYTSHETGNTYHGSVESENALLSASVNDTPPTTGFEPAEDFSLSAKKEDKQEQASTLDLVTKAPNEPDWTRSTFGLSSQAFSKETSEILLAPINIEDIECKPDGMIYLPEIKYRRILNKAFGPGGWGLAPRGDAAVNQKNISREYCLVVGGRLISVARGEQEYFDPTGLPTAAEGAKSNALMRCCKDLGIASELWDPNFIRDFKREYCEEMFVEHMASKKRRKIWRKKGVDLEYPYKVSTNSYNSY